IGKNVTIQGSGFGNALTSGGHSTGGDPAATFIEADPAAASLFSIDADLTIRNLRILGAAAGIRLSDDGGPDPVLTVEDCVFDRQSGWAVQADDDDGNAQVWFLSSLVDASLADSLSGAGGLYLDNLTYGVYNSGFYSQSPAVPGAGILALSGSGVIDSSIFGGNAIAIWASAGSSVITSCNISGTAAITNGINLTGGPGGALIRRNTIDGNSGYGLRVGGEMALYLRKNAITDNGLSGVLIDSELDNPSLVNIDMGTLGDKGNNLFNGNEHPDGVSGFETQVYVTLATQEGAMFIPANWNYWGVSSIPEVNIVIIDGNDNAGRATLAIGNIYLTEDPEVGP
ncbi:MAG: right-handed parallel beta-helix repeat-containing protein, partial [Pseudomonadota bacterium]